MTIAKLLFDECIGVPHVESLRGLLGVTNEQVEVGHVVKMGFGGQNDDIWIPKIAGEGWLIVTADRGKKQRAGSGEKLMNVCREYHVSFAAMSASIHHQPSFAKVRLLLAIWEDLVNATKQPRGSQYAMRLTNAGGARLVLVSGPQSPEKQPKQQGLPGI